MPKIASFIPGIYALILSGLGFIFVLGGIYLASLGGSPYYFITGFALILTAWCFWRGDQRALWLYGAIVAGTLAWSILEAGFDPLALAARNGLFIGLGFCLLLPPLWRRLSWKGRIARPNIGVSALAGIAVIAGAAAFAPPVLSITMADSMVTLPAAAAAPSRELDQRPSQWTNVGRDLTGDRYTPVAQITPENVKKLELVWSYRTGDIPNVPFSFQSANLQVDNKLLICTPDRQIHALDPATGKLLWRFVPSPNPRAKEFPPNCRGVSYHSDNIGGHACSGRVFVSTDSNVLWAVDVETGRPCADFGHNGSISLADGFDPKRVTEIKNTTPGTVVGNLLIVGMKILDGHDQIMPSGVVRAFDVNSGKLVWAWDMGKPERTGLPPAGETYTNSTPNAWVPFSADPSLSLVYVPTGNAPPDFFGGYRRPFDEKYGSSIVALDIRTGRPRWAFQTVHHDLWDFDLPSQPILVDWPTNAGPRKALVQFTKQGDIFVLDRATGRPIVPVKEVVAPRGGIKEEHYSRTQPVSALSLAPRKLRESDMWGLTPIDQMLCRISYRKNRYDGIYTPPGLDSSIGYSGAGGITNWGSGVIDPRNKIIITNTTNVAMISQVLHRAKGDVKVEYHDEFGFLEMAHTPYRFYNGIMYGALGMPCNRPPWGELVGIDMRTGKFAWRRPYGTAKDSGPLGIPTGLPISVGTPSLGGNLVIGSGLSFIAATMDHTFRAIDIRTGKELWSAPLPAGGTANPVSYVANGRQFIVLSAGGHVMLPARHGDYVLAYALPKTSIGH